MLGKRRRAEADGIAPECTHCRKVFRDGDYINVATTPLVYTCVHCMAAGRAPAGSVLRELQATAFVLRQPGAQQVARAANLQLAFAGDMTRAATPAPAPAPVDADELATRARRYVASGTAPTPEDTQRFVRALEPDASVASRRAHLMRAAIGQRVAAYMAATNASVRAAALHLGVPYQHARIGVSLFRMCGAPPTSFFAALARGLIQPKGLKHWLGSKRVFEHCYDAPARAAIEARCAALL